MPLNGFVSLCDKNAAQIVSKDKGNPQYHRGNNPGRAYAKDRLPGRRYLNRMMQIRSQKNLLPAFFSHF